MNDQPKHTNRLINETSPYLLQHAHNPVDWFPWGDQALELAKKEDKPILLSIGYSACHWCHVMERESFENEKIADLMNQHFVNIKVDREERPDLDEIYMSAVQTLTGSGGWPMTVFLTPDLKPFYGGTYFPPEDRYGRPGFPRVLIGIADAYKNRRSDVTEQADLLTDRIQQIFDPEQTSQKSLTDQLIKNAFENYKNRFDPGHGGFGSAPKFPPSMGLNLLLRYWRVNGDPHALHMVELTLEKMANGGIYDQLGGGFHRYSVDEIWLVPHFEKMLYDNALLMISFLEIYQITGNPFYKKIITETFDYLLREMFDHENGGFYATQDADSEGVEGKFFVWTIDEITEILGEKTAKIFSDFYDISEHGNFEHKNILRIKTPIDQFAKKWEISKTEMRQILDDAKIKLFDHREKRIKPGLDDKILTSWNGLMIRSFAIGYQIFEDQRYLDAAARSANFILENVSQNDGRLFRTHRNDKSHLNAYLEDYAYFIAGLIELYQASFDPRWLKEADRLTKIAIDQFWDQNDGGFFFTGKDHEKLIARSKSAHDGATPSATSMTVHNLIRLAILLDQPDLRKKAEQTLQFYLHQMEIAPNGSAQLLCEVDFILNAPKEFAIIGDRDSDQTQQILRQIHSEFIPNKVIALSNPRESDLVSDLIPLLKDKIEIDEKPTVYICENFACQQPITDLQNLKSALKSF